MFKVNNKKIRTTSDVFDTVDVLKYFWTYFTPFSTVSVVDFEQVNISCDVPLYFNAFPISCKVTTKPAFTFFRSTMETPGQRLKSV